MNREDGGGQTGPGENLVRDLSNYWKTRWKCALYCGAVFAVFHFYFVFAVLGGRAEYLYYLEFLLLVLSGGMAAADYLSFVKQQGEKRRLLGQQELICRMFPDFENRELAEHDVRLLEKQLAERFQENCDLQDYVAKWCHELKLPLAAGMLIQGQIGDVRLRNSMREQLERMNRQSSSMLLGCRLQGELFDLQVRQTALRECVNASIHNNQFFLIQKGFSMRVEVGEELVYTDPAWLVYVLDQLISNAVKYRKGEERKASEMGQPEEQRVPEAEGQERKGKEGCRGRSKEQGRDQPADTPGLCLWTERNQELVKLFVEDYGAGIRDCDLPRIFEKGFTGQNTHNGKYKSTGMGLYLAAKIVGRMGHELRVESEYGSYTRFCIVFRGNDYFRGK